jgi:hypothetical protein
MPLSMLVSRMVLSTHDWNWWLNSDAGLLARISIGAAVFLALAAWDLGRNGGRARRWREYLFLLAATAAGVAYGVVNDSITSSISWEFFYFGKGLDAVLGPHTPPAMAALRWEAIKVGMKAAGSAGVLAGAIVLLANSASRRRPDMPQLSFSRLAAYLGAIALGSAAGAALLGAAGYFGELSWMSKALRGIAEEDLFRPARFHCVYGIHLGSYAGGILGTMIACWRIQVERKHKGPGVTKTPGPLNREPQVGDAE